MSVRGLGATDFPESGLPSSCLACDAITIDGAIKEKPRAARLGGVFRLLRAALEGVLVEPAGIEPASVSLLQPVLHT